MIGDEGPERRDDIESAFDRISALLLLEADREPTPTSGPVRSVALTPHKLASYQPAMHQLATHKPAAHKLAAHKPAVRSMAAQTLSKPPGTPRIASWVAPRPSIENAPLRSTEAFARRSPCRATTPTCSGCSRPVI